MIAWNYARFREKLDREKMAKVICPDKDETCNKCLYRADKIIAYMEGK